MAWNPIGVAFRRLPRRLATSLQHYRTLRRFPRPFFASNPVDLDLQDTPQAPLQQVEQYLGRQQPFLDPNIYYPEVEITDHSIMDTAMDHTFEPFSTWKEIGRNQQLSPIAGSFIEFESDSALVLGVVIAEPQSKFNEYHNKLIVLTMHNELVRVYPQDIHFTAYQVLEKEWIDSLDILTNRFNEQFAPRTRLVTILHQYIACANSFRQETRENLRIAHSRMSSDVLRPTSLIGVQDYFPAQLLPSYFHQSARLISVHWEMCRDPSRWVVVSCVSGSRTTNIVAHRCSNELPPVPIYMATPLDVFSNVSEFLQYDETRLAQLEAYIGRTSNTTEIQLDVRFGGGRPFDKAIRAILFGAFYPHGRITGRLKKMKTFQKASPSGILSLLRQKRLFSGDILYASGMVGRPMHAVSATKDDIPPSHSVLSSRRDAKVGSIWDKFAHLREKRQYYHDMVVYSVPGSKLAFSLEKVNERKYRLNIHFPDVASRLDPSSRTFELWSTSGILRTIDGLTDGNKVELLDQTAIDIFLLKGSSSSDFFVVGDMADMKNLPSYYCMTLTFEYNTYENDPLKNISDNISISFDSLYQNQFKALDNTTLEHTLTGRLQPRLLDSFRLFNRTEPQEPVLLDQNDHFNINFAYNILSRHQLQRNRQCAASVEPGSFNMNHDLKRMNSKRNFFVHEFDLFAGAIAAEYCQKHNIPVYRNTQTLLDKTEAETNPDEVFISHENKLLPNYHGSSYFQTLLARNSGGFISPAAYFIGNNYLGQKKLSVNGDTWNLPLGLSLGYVDVSAMDSVEAYLNQLQILAHVNSQQAMKTRDSSSFSQLKKFGYPVQGPFSARVLDLYTRRLEDSVLAVNYIRDRQRKYWTLLHAQQNPDREYNCVVTRMGAEISPTAQLAWAFCEELAMEVRIYVNMDEDISIGLRVAAKMLHVDPDNMWCVLAYKEPY